MWGLLPSDVEEIVEVWPEHEAALGLFSRMGTQWNVGMGGPIGLRYEALYPLIRRTCPGQFDETLDQIQVMEAEALAVMQKPKDNPK